MHLTRVVRFGTTSLRAAASPLASLSSTTSAFGGRLKKSTNITGLAVSSSPLVELESKLKSTIKVLSSLPEVSVYRQATEALTNHKLSIVQHALTQTKGVENNPQRLEQVYEQAEYDLDQGQLEQVIEQANHELILAGKMAEWKAWEPLEHPPSPGQWAYFSMAEEAGEGGEDHDVDPKTK